VGRVTKGAVNALLANLYLNARVYKNEAAGAGINATGYNTCAGMTVSGPKDACQAAIDVADSIINSGVYQLAPAFTDNFNADNATSPENIFVIKFADADGLGFNMVMRTLHYNQFSPRRGTALPPWRRRITRSIHSINVARCSSVGPQVNVESGKPTTDRRAPAGVHDDGRHVTSATEGGGLPLSTFTCGPTRNILRR